MSKSTSTRTETVVTVIAKPLGGTRENGPHLADLRQFVAECEGLPDDVRVYVDQGHLSASGGRDVTLRAHYTHPSEPAR